MSLVDLLCDEENDYQTISSDILIGGNYTIENIGINDFDSSKRIIKYYELISICNKLNNILKNRELNVMFLLFRILKGIIL